MAESLKERLVIWIWNHTLNCAEMSRLASRSLDGPLPLWIWLKMRLHYLFCLCCKRYSKHLKFLHASAPHFDEETALLPNRILSASAKQRIVHRLQAG